MNHWSRPDRVIAYIRLARRPVTLVECTDALRDNYAAVSATLSYLHQRGELNRVQLPDAHGRLRYHYSDPDYEDEAMNEIALDITLVVTGLITAAYSIVQSQDPGNDLPSDSNDEDE